MVDYSYEEALDARRESVSDEPLNRARERLALVELRLLRAVNRGRDEVLSMDQLHDEMAELVKRMRRLG